MKYRIVNNGRRKYNIQKNILGIFWLSWYLDVETVEKAEELIEKDALRRADKKDKGKVVKVIGFTAEDRTLWKLQGK